MNPLSFALGIVATIVGAIILFYGWMAYWFFTDWDMRPLSQREPVWPWERLWLRIAKQRKRDRR